MSALANELREAFSELEAERATVSLWQPGSLFVAAWRWLRSSRVRRLEAEMESLRHLCSVRERNHRYHQTNLLVRIGALERQISHLASLTRQDK